MIAIIDYGLGNLYSVAGAIEKLGHTAVITRDVKEMEKADKLIELAKSAGGQDNITVVLSAVM